MRGQMFQKSKMQTVPRFIGDKTSFNGTSEKAHIANDVQDLVPYEFIMKAEAALIKHPVVSDDNGVVHGTSHGQSLLTKRAHIFQETERPGSRNVTDKRLRIYRNLQVFLTDGRMIEIEST